MVFVIICKLLWVLIENSDTIPFFLDVAIGEAVGVALDDFRSLYYIYEMERKQELMTAKEFARRLNVPYTTVAGWLQKGQAPGATDVSSPDYYETCGEVVFAGYFKPVEFREAAKERESKQAMKSLTTRNIQIGKQTRRVLRKAAGAGRQPSNRPTEGREAKKGGAAK
jgi:hypothetical protein